MALRCGSLLRLIMKVDFLVVRFAGHEIKVKCARHINCYHLNTFNSMSFDRFQNSRNGASSAEYEIFVGRH
jgi:hypothetical protein